MKKILTAAALGLAGTLPAFAGDLLVTAARPSNLYVFDAENRELKNDCMLEGNMLPGGIVMSASESSVMQSASMLWKR